MVISLAKPLTINMFKEKNLLHKMPTAPEVLDGLGTRLPERSIPHFQQVEKSQAGFEQIEGAKEMVVFVPEEDPESLLNHPVLGPILKPYNDRGALFANRRNPLDRSKSTGLKTDVVTIPVEGFGSVKTIYLISGSSPEGNPEGDEFTLHRKVRSSAAQVKDIVGDENEQNPDSSSIAIFLDGQVVTHANAGHYLTALGQGVGNITYEADLYKSEPGEISKDGKLSDAERIQLEFGKQNGWTPSKEGMTPEAEFAEMHRALELKETTLPTPEEAKRTTRNALKNVYLVSDVEGNVDTESLLASFEKGDTISRVKSLCKFLSEAPHRLLNCELFTRVLNKLNEEVSKMGTNTEIEIYGPNIDGITVTGSLQSFGRKLEVLEAVHQGSGSELGPFMVRMKYRHPNANGQPVHVLAGKSLMFDNGGNCNKNDHAKSMQGDMMGGASVASEFARFGEEQPEMNVDFVFGIASNKADGDARNLGDIMRHGAGGNVEELNTDAEGREVLGDTLWAAVRRLREEGQEVGSVLTIATLTGAAILAGGHRSLAISKSKAARRKIEDLSTANGDNMQPEALIIEDRKATGPRRTAKGDMSNVDSRRIRGAQNAAEYIKTAAGIEEVPHMHFDIAPAMDADRDGTPKDVQGEFACEGYLQTLHEYLLWLGSQKKEQQAA